jgi:hypothetical protein
MLEKKEDKACQRTKEVVLEEISQSKDEDQSRGRKLECVQVEST